MSVKSFSRPLAALTLCLAFSACLEPTVRPRPTQPDERRYTREGEIDLKPETVTAEILDESSILHPTRMAKEGFKLDWSTNLMDKGVVRNLWLYPDTVLIETETNQLHSMDRATGHYKWVIQLAHPLDFEPAFNESVISGNRMFYAVARNQLYAIDATRTVTGRELGVLRWKFLLPYTASTPPHANEYFVAIGTEEKNFVTTVLANKVKPDPNYKPRVISWKRSLNGRLTATPASSSDREDATLMVATGQGTIYGLNFNSGEREWHFPGTYLAGAFKAPLVIHGDYIFAANTDHTLYILNRASGGLWGKIVLDSPLTAAPWVVGNMKLHKDKDSDKIVRVENDLDIFVQSEPSIDNPNGVFYLIRNHDIVIRDEDILNITTDNPTIISKRRWITKIEWKLKGKYDYLFRTRTRIFLQHGNDMVVVRRHDGEVVRRIDLGGTELKIHYDPTSEYDLNRLFMATKNGGVFSLELK